MSNMFNFEQLELNSSFVHVDNDCELGEVMVLLEQHHFVVWSDQETYVIDRAEAAMLQSYNSEMKLSDWIAEVKLPFSTVCTRDALMELKLDSSRPIVLGDGRSIQGIVTTASLVSCLLDEKRQLSLFFETLVETVNDVVTAVDQEGRVICWNEAAEQFYGIRKDRIIGRKTSEHFERESIMLQRILEEGPPVRKVYHQPTPDAHVLISASPIVDKGIIIGGVATEQDIGQIVQLNKELYADLSSKRESSISFDAIIGSGPVFKRVLEMARKFAAIQTPILLTGEAGAGKEMLAQAIHYGGQRKQGEFLVVHCGALPGGLLENELFGSQGGVFTPPEDQAGTGKLELAAGGTLLLKDIDQMPIHIQLKLLQYLKSGTFHRVGSSERVISDARIIAATSSSLQTLMEEGFFLEELYYKLKVMEIELQPLRERTEDLPELVQSFLREYSLQYNKLIPTLDKEVMTALMNYDWPGNIRELRNVVERLVVLGDGAMITVEQLPQGLISELDRTLSRGEEDDSISLKTRLSDYEEQSLIEEALRKAYGNKSAAAKLLGISRGTLYNKMKEYGMK